MEKEILNLTPKRFLCPYCGEWHEWDKPYELGYYNSSNCKASLKCSNAPYESNQGNYEIYFYEDYLYYSMTALCGKADQEMNGKILISSIIEEIDKPIVTFDVKFISNDAVGMLECIYCDFKEKCNCVRLGDKSDNFHMTIKFGFEFDQAEYNQLSKFAQVHQRMDEFQECEDSIKIEEIEQPQSKQSIRQEIKEDTTMATNIFNMEFGPNKDKNIASTLMGIAVKNGDNWRIYDKQKKEITDIGDIQLGNLPIFIFPTTKLKEGDLIKDASEYYFVIKVTKGNTQTMSAKTGEMKTIIPIKNILGFSCYSKVIALSDSLNMSEDFDAEKLAIMSAVCGTSIENKNQMNQLLPFMLCKDKIDGNIKKMMLMSTLMSIPAGTSNQNATNQLLPIMLLEKKDSNCNDDMMAMLMCSMMSTPEGSDNQNTANQLLPIMLMKEKDGNCNDDVIKMFLMSSMMCGNVADDNPIMKYLLLNMIMDKEKSEQPSEV